MFGGLSMWEILVIMAIALIIFGPRKLPELGRTIGQSLAQFRKASEDFKRSWEEEITLEEKRLSRPAPRPWEENTIEEQSVSQPAPEIPTTVSEQPRESEQS
jgi:TatA/E family protein of Tat protein translocase